jgi:hypothetical protein
MCCVPPTEKDRSLRTATVGGLLVLAIVVVSLRLVEKGAGLGLIFGGFAACIALGVVIGLAIRAMQRSA